MALRDLYLEVGGPVRKDRLWFYSSYRIGRTGLYIPGFVQLSDRSQVEFFTETNTLNAKVTWQVSKSNKFEGMWQKGRKWQPHRTASRFVPLEATQNQDSSTEVGPSLMHSRAVAGPLKQPPARATTRPDGRCSAMMIARAGNDLNIATAAS
jgi:hypothetical protein